MFSIKQIQNPQIFIEKLEDAQLMSINVYQLFQMTKNFLGTCSQGSQSTEKLTPTQNACKLKTILERKLCRKFLKKSNNFIGLLCIYIYLSNSDPKKRVLELKKQFSKNLHKALLTSYLQLKKNEGKADEKCKLISFSTLLFIIVTFIQKIADNQLENDCIFTDKLLCSFFSFQFPDDEKLLKSYQIIMLYLIKTKESPSMKKQMFHSIFRHIGCNSLPENSAYIFTNYIKRFMKYYSSVSIEKQNKQMLVKKLKNLIFASDNISRIFNILEILSKMEDSHLSIDEYILIFAKFLNKKDLIEDNCNLFRKIIKFIKPSHQDEGNADKLMCFIFQNNISPILTLEVTKILIPYLSFDLLLHFSYGNKLLENLKSLIRNDEDEEKVGLSLEVIDQILQRLSVQNLEIFTIAGKQIQSTIKSINISIRNKYLLTICNLQKKFKEIDINAFFIN